MADGFSNGAFAYNLCYIQNNNYNITIGIIKMNTTVSEPINVTVNQTTGIDANGNNITTPVNVSTEQTQDVNVDVFQQILVNMTNTTFGNAPNQYSKNGYTYYQFGAKNF